jgi:hypothetical protein
VPAGAYAIDNPELGSPRQVELSRADVTDLTIIADAIGRITVHVVTRRGEPVDGLSVHAVAADGRPCAPPEEMGAGVYTFGTIAAGSYAVRVHDGVNPVVQAGGSSGEVKVVAGQTTALEVEFGGYKGRIRGRVLDDRSAPVANVWVRAKPLSARADIGAAMQESRILEESRRGLSDDEGAFEIDGLAEDGSFVVVAERPLGGQAQLENVKAGATIELRLESLGALSGVAVGPTGEPIENLSLTISNQRSGQQRAEVVYEPQGRWRIEDVTPGPVQITAVDRYRNLAIITQELLPKQRLGGIRLELHPAAAGATGDVVAGAVTPTNEPQSGVVPLER